MRKGVKDAFHGCEKVEKTFWFCDFFIYIYIYIYIYILKTAHSQQLKGMQKSKLGYMKGVPFVNRRYTKGVPL